MEWSLVQLRVRSKLWAWQVRVWGISESEGDWKDLGFKPWSGMERQTMELSKELGINTALLMAGDLAMAH